MKRFLTFKGESSEQKFMDYEKRDFPGKGKSVGILGVPLGFGAGEIGSDMGPAALRSAHIRGKTLFEHIEDLGFEVKNYGDVKIINPEKPAKNGENPRYLKEILASSENMANDVKKILDNGEFPVIIGGDHSIGLGTFSGVSSFFHQQNQEVGLIWFDAHADMNTPETSPSGNIHGMPLATILGIGEDSLVNIEGFSPKINPKHLAHVGGRDLDLGEKKLIRELGIRDQVFTMSDIDRLGIAECVRRSIEIASRAEAGYAVTFDVDVIDPRFAPGSGTLVRGGMSYRESHLALEMVAESEKMRSFEIVEVNPMLDERNITVKLAGELILSALGKTIL